MAVQILYFANVREKLGRGGDVLDLPDSVTTPEQLVDWLIQRDPASAAAFADRDRLRCAVDQVITALDAPLGQPAEIAFFPPVTGG